MTTAINPMGSVDLMDTVRRITDTQRSLENFAPTGSTKAATETAGAPNFGDMLSNLLQQVDSKQKSAQAEVRAVMTGQSTNIHQAMLSMQESSVAMSLMSEVRNKLVSAYQELMRMQV